MNIKAITRAMELSDDDWELATKLRALSETERELLMTALGPHKPATRKSSKKAGKKSARASGMAAAISGSLQRSRSATGGLPDGVSQLCLAQVDDNGGLMECGEVADHNVHHKQTDPNYHPFQPAASFAPPPSDQASSEIGKGVAGGVHRAAGSGGSD